MMMRCSRSPLWRNTVGLCEVQSRIPDPLALSELVSREGACVLASFKHTPHQKHGMSQICDECRREQMSVRLSCRKPVV